MPKYWFKQCPRCRQGQLFIHSNRETQSLYLHCDECEWGFADPTKCDSVDDGFFAMNIHYDEPTLDVIQQRGWSEFAMHRDEVEG